MSESGRMLLADLLERTRYGSYLRRAHALSGLVVLNYHRIGTASESLFDHGLWSATEEDFHEQLLFLKENFDVITPVDLPDALRSSGQRSVMITFDDGYADNYSSAFTILRQHRVPAVFFLSTGFLDHPRLSWWDEIAWMVRTSKQTRIPLEAWGSSSVTIDVKQPESAIRRILRVYKQLPTERTESLLEHLAQATGAGRATKALADGMWMTWDMVREMHLAGMTIGGHTIHHPILAQLPPPQQQEEISGSCRRIASEIDAPVETFSFPVGGPTAYNEATLQALEAAGIRWAFTYGFGGYVRDSHLPYQIPRLPIESDLSLMRFRALTTLPGLFS